MTLADLSVPELKDKIYSTSEDFEKQVCASIKINLLDLFAQDSRFRFVPISSLNAEVSILVTKADGSLSNAVTMLLVYLVVCLRIGTSCAQCNKIASACPLSRNKLGFVRRRRRHPLCDDIYTHGERRSETPEPMTVAEDRRRCHRCQIGMPARW